MFRSPCRLTVVAVVFLFCTHSQAQTTWVELTGAPITSRHNDAYFVSADEGWVVNGAGEIWTTKDGGASWDRQHFENDSHFRSVGFVNDSVGFAGNVGEGEFGTTDRTALYSTSDAGQTWDPVGAYNGRTPTGICGMQVVNDSMVVAVGRVRGPAFFVKTTDRGTTWISKDMHTYAAGLIDVHFFDPDHGIAVGLTNADHAQSRAIILTTTDGGETWTTTFTSSRQGEWAWKISFPTSNVGYVSLQRNVESPIFFLKTNDGGVTWDEKLFSGSHYFVQGLGFIDENNGWIGGNSSFPTFVTSDGGDSWVSADFGVRVNRFRFLGDSLGYAVGQTVYKYDARAVGVGDEKPDAKQHQLSIETVYPNPSSGAVALRYNLDAPALVRAGAFDVYGREITPLFHAHKSAGVHEITWHGLQSNGNRVAGGLYFIVLRTKTEVATSTVVLK